MKTEKGVNGFNFVFWGAVILLIFGLVIFFTMNMEMLVPVLVITTIGIIVFIILLILGF
jgi:hypothetical protein